MPFWAELPLSRSGRANTLPQLFSCPYRDNFAQRRFRGPGCADFDERWKRLPAILQRYVWEISIHGSASEHNAIHRVPIRSFENALTAFFAIWTGGRVREVPRHWQPSYWNVSPADHRTLTHFFAKLANTSDFRHPMGQQHLMARLDRALQAMQQDPLLFERILILMDLPPSSCFDTMALSFNDVDLEVHKHMILARTDDLDAATEALSAFGLSLIKLNVVRAHAADYWRRFDFNDEIEIHLKFEVLLAQELHLPLAAQSLRYGRYFHVDHQALAAAAREAHWAAADPATVEAFFAQWEPWQLHQRKLTARRFTWETLPTRTWISDSGELAAQRCAISRDAYQDVPEPVLLGRGKHARLYNFADIVAWWILNDQDPLTRDTFDLTDLYRVIDEPPRDGTPWPQFRAE